MSHKKSNSQLWAVMKAYSWDSITTEHGMGLRCPSEGPHRFIPVFNTRKQAVKWAVGSRHVAKLAKIYWPENDPEKKGQL